MHTGSHQMEIATTEPALMNSDNFAHNLMESLHIVDIWDTVDKDGAQDPKSWPLIYIRSFTCIAFILMLALVFFAACMLYKVEEIPTTGMHGSGGGRH